jgi:transglutaminase/protease-like cytokinesis protein 3
MKRLAFLLFVFYSSVLFCQVSDFAATDFQNADSIAEQYAAHSLMDLKTLADNLSGSLSTEQEKFRAIYKWVCSNIEADYELVLLNKQSRIILSGDALLKWNRKFNKMVFETLQREYKTVCTGYAYLLRELAFHAGLTCVIVNGYAKHSGVNRAAPGLINHSWNMIRLNDKWYVCDATWSSGIFNVSAGKFIKKYDDRYFLMKPSLFFKTHYAVEQ